MEFNGREIEIKIWSNEQLGSLIAVDTETDFRPFHTTPEIITCQAYAGGSVAYYVPLDKLKLFFNKHYESTLIFHNFPFDADVLTEKLGRGFAYDLIDRDKVRDTSVLYRLYHLGTKGFIPFKYNLALLTDIFCNEVLNKDAGIRCNFEQFRGKAIEEIPTDFLEYGAIDAVATFDVYLSLSSRIAGIDKHNTLLSHNIQLKGDLALTHTHKNGIQVDLKRKDEVLGDLVTRLQEQADILATWGWVRGLKGINDRFESILGTIGIADKLPKTEDGSLSSKGEDLEPYRNIQFVDSYLKFNEIEKASSFLNKLDSERVHPRYNLIVNTGRTSCSKPNFQQLPKAGGIRECFVAKEGHSFIITDYSAIELATLAQTTYDMYGDSEMRRQINAGIDLHKYYASVMHNCPASAVSKQQRSEAKAANFGFPGGLGIDTFIEFSRGYGLDLSPDVAQQMKDTWFKAFPEMRKYMQNEVGHVFTRTGRLRANTSYCAEKNSPFQGLAADGAKLALYELDKAGYTVVGFVHDEIICEVRDDRVEELLKEQERIMISSMQQVVPDVKIGVESMISKEYTK